MIEVNAIGDACPIPVIKTKKALAALTGPETVKVLVDNEIAVQNVTKFGQSAGGKVTSAKEAEKKFVITIEMDGAPKAELPADDAVNCAPDQRGDLVAVVAADHMGEGNEKLGKVLIKGFLFALSQLDTLPKTILFYNGGAQLTCEGSDSLEDLKNMEAQGVEILTCGTCLDYYELKEKLAVGGITNMYTIVEKIANAGRVIRP